jgi:hypothetical protein
VTVGGRSKLIEEEKAGNKENAWVLGPKSALMVDI